MKFENKVVIVTGGASGIGMASVLAFAKEGARVVVADFSPKGKDVAELACQEGGDAFFVQTDVANEESVQNMVDQTVKHYGAIDILFANAGIAQDNRATDLSLETWQRTIDVNLTGVFLCDRAVIAYWLAQKRPGVIVNSGSIHSFVGRSGVTAYAASKGGVKLLTQTLVLDYARNGIRVNAVCPGYIDTPLLDHIDPAKKRMLAMSHPQGRLGRVDEVVSVVLFLAGDGASFVNGASILVDGGYTAQ